MSTRRNPAARENGKKGGRPKGRKNELTIIAEEISEETKLDRKQILKEVQQRILNAADVLINAQLSRARGQTFLYKIEKYYETVTDDKGKTRRVLRAKPPKLVTAEREIRDYLERNTEGPGGGMDLSSPEDDYYFITTKEPDSTAIERLFNRVFGNSVQPISLVDDDGQSVFTDQQKKLSDTAINAYLQPTKKSASKTK